VSSCDELIVDLGERSYEIKFGLLENLGGALAAIRDVGRCFVVSNPVVSPLYSKVVVESLLNSGWEPVVLEIPDGEVNKGLDSWSSLVSQLLDNGVDRSSPVLALGGGVTGDIVGFAAATVLRGVPFVQVPTSLLAMVDSSVGGKTGINTKHGKNLVGAFHQPSLVYVDVHTLNTLAPEEFRSGLGEVVKHALLADEAFFVWLEENVDDVLGLDQAALQFLVRRCCEIKGDVVSQDEFESGWRAVLNLGHTIAHAIEKVVGYGKIRHGEAVAVGLLAEAVMAVNMGACEPSVIKRLRDLLTSLGLPKGVSGVLSDDLVLAVNSDKKLRRGKLLLPVPICVGKVKLLSVEPSSVGGAAEAAVI